MKEKSKIAKEIVVLSIGPTQAQETLRTALALGADRGIHVETDKRIDQLIQPLLVARIFQKIILKE